MHTADNLDKHYTPFEIQKKAENLGQSRSLVCISKRCKSGSTERYSPTSNILNTYLVESRAKITLEMQKHT